MLAITSVHAPETFYSANKVAIAMKKPTKTFGDASELAPFEWPEVDPVEEDVGEDVTIEVAVDVGVLAVVELDEALLRAALRSWGIVKGVELAELRSMRPLSFNTPVLDARKLRVKSTFSATNVCDQEGKVAKSMFAPQLAALVLFAVIFVV